MKASMLLGVAPAGVSYSDDTTSRERWPDAVNQEGEHNLALRDAADTPQHGWQRYVVPMMQGFLNRGLPGVAVNTVNAALDPRAANRLKYGGRVAESDARLGTLRTQRKDQLDERLKRAQIGHINAQSEDIRTQKPLRDAATFEDKQKCALLAQLKGMPTVDPTKHAAFLDGCRLMRKSKLL